MGRKVRSNETKLQVPIDKQVRAGLEKRAQELGFDSAQAYVRFWAKAQASGRDMEGQDLSKPNIQALRYIELMLAFNENQPASARAALDYVLEQLNAVKLGRYLEQTLRSGGLR